MAQNLNKMHAVLRQRLLARFKTPDVPSRSLLLLQGLYFEKKKKKKKKSREKKEENDEGRVDSPNFFFSHIFFLSPPIGGKQGARDNTDNETLFRQESNFHYLFGVNEGGFYATLHIEEGKSVLFMPRLPAAYAVWMGKVCFIYFLLLFFGVNEGGFYATLHIEEGKSVLFMPRLPAAYAVWMGKVSFYLFIFFYFLGGWGVRGTCILLYTISLFFGGDMNDSIINILTFFFFFVLSRSSLVKKFVTSMVSMKFVMSTN